MITIAVMRPTQPVAPMCVADVFSGSNTDQETWIFMRLKTRMCGIPHASEAFVIAVLVSRGAPHSVSACVKT